MVAPLPEEAALEPGRRLDRVPVLGEGPVAVPDRVAVFAHHERVPLAPGDRMGDDRLDGRVHRTRQVAGTLVARPVEVDGTLVVERT